MTLINLISKFQFPQPRPTVVDKESDIGVISCSSGTTGPSKSLTLNYDVPLFTRLNLFDSSEIFYCADGIFWTIGIKEILDCVYSGATRIITTKPYLPELPLEIVHKYRVTILPIAAFDLIACLKTDLIRTVDLSSVRQIFVYGGHVPNILTDQVYRYFPNAKLSIWYGLTEIGMISAYDPKESKDGGGNFGFGYTIKVIDDNGNRCGPNTLGELCVKKEHTFHAYLDDPTATAAALDDEGFFQTGDIVYIDDNGRLFIKDRKKNVLTLFYFDGILVPFELEECLIDMPGVKEVCVVGVPITGGATLPAAVVIRKSNSMLSKRDVLDKIEGEKSNSRDQFMAYLSVSHDNFHFISHFRSFSEAIKTSSRRLFRRFITENRQWQINTT